jgi:hypothetical protein
MSIKCLFDAVEGRGDIGRRVAALVLPISNRPRVTSSCEGKLRLREAGEYTSGPNLASRDKVAHNQNLYTILETPAIGHPVSKRHTLVVVEALARTGLLDANCNSRQGLKFFGYRTPTEAMPVADAVYTSDHLVHSGASPGQRGAGLLSSV